MSWSHLPPAMAILGAVVGLAAVLVRGRLAMLAATLGWLGILTTASLVQFGGRVGMSVAPVPAAFAMAGSAALVVAPVGASSGLVRRLGVALPAVVAGAGAAASIAYLTTFEPAPWPQGGLLIGVHWGALAASLAAALVAPTLRVAAWWKGRSDGESSEQARILRAFGRDFTARAVALVWLAWTLGVLVHWRFLGAPGLGTRSEWFGLGVALLATGGMMFGWPLDDRRAARIRGGFAAWWVAAVLVAGIWLSFGFGTPFQLSLGA